MKNFFLPISLIIFFSVIVGILVWWKKSSGPVSSDFSEVRLIIPKGYSVTQVARKLEERGLIKNILAFKVYVQVKGKSREIKAGEYDLKKNLTLKEITEVLLRGPSEVWITVPEGLRREEIALKFTDGLEKMGDEREFFLSEFLSLTKTKEGYLFPDTYLFSRNVSAGKVVAAMLRNFEKRIAELDKDISSSKYDINQILTMASLVEREVLFDDERLVVAGILLKRLESDWPLQVDAAVQYAVASSRCNVMSANCKNWWPILIGKDIKINSQYNTYKYKGLPPAPISNPGILSIKAVLYSKETDYWYYLHDKDGKIHYAKTLEGHNLNIRKYLGK